ncbi:MAG TPA: hypothetical protein VJN18_23225 [Polyangiaceae bacterium]|nr:hypothetical protein [Polyangiaceae bacterium]
MTLSSAPESSSFESALDEQDADRRARRKATVVTVIGLLLAFAGALLLWLETRAEEVSAIREIPAAQRSELYQSTRRALLAVCDPPRRPAGLEDYCDAQARFIQQFDECDEACRDVARHAARQPRH